MEFVFDLVVMIWMMVGLMCTLLPKLPGTLIIFSGALLYGYIHSFDVFQDWTILSLTILVILAEIGGRLMRYQLTRRFPFSPEFGSNTTVGNFGGIVASDALMGIVGLMVWQLAVGKNLLPRWDAIGRLLVRSSAAALFRFVCGAAMILIFFFSVYI